MKCPGCGYTESKVLDSRPSDEGTSIRRRRECLGCQRRFTTYEKLEEMPVMVIKKDGSRQLFDRSKLLGGIMHACQKRPVSYEEMDRIVKEVESVAMGSIEHEISSKLIGEMVMEGLKKTDEVAYVRFASVYRQFKDIETFMGELETLLKEQKNN
jgi:transcriptional repressor NrdR